MLSEISAFNDGTLFSFKSKMGLPRAVMYLISLDTFESLRVAFPAACGAHRSRQRDRRLAHHGPEIGSPLQYPAPWGGDPLLPARSLISVDLPAPFSPSSARIEPARTLRSMRSTASVPPKRLETPAKRSNGNGSA